MKTSFDKYFDIAHLGQSFWRKLTLEYKSDAFLLCLDDDGQLLDYFSFGNRESLLFLDHERLYQPWKGHLPEHLHLSAYNPVPVIGSICSKYAVVIPKLSMMSLPGTGFI